MGTRLGRLVKKDDHKVMDALEMEKYPWLNFSDQGVIFPDNPRKSVILQKMHDPMELESKILNARDFKKALGGKSVTLFPTDLTQDFEKGRKEMAIRRRRNLMDEEEAMALELSEMEHNVELKTARKAQEKIKQKSKAKQEETKETETQSNESSALSFIPQEEISQKKIEEPPQEKVEEIEKLKEKNESLLAEAQKEGFDKGEKEGFEEGKKEGFESGSREGFQSGEERGMAAAESKYERAFENISEVATRLADLKETLLTQGKDIFVELTKLCCEKILREQIKSSDASLSHLFDEVLKSYNTKSSLNIEMNSNDASRIRKHVETLKDPSKIQIKENDSLDNGAFHVESDTGVSLVDLKKSVNSIIENLKADLFQDQIKVDSEVSSPEKKKA